MSGEGELGGSRSASANQVPTHQVPTHQVPTRQVPTRQVPAPHPATLPPPDLLADCTLRAQRRSGPGGQHRNKTSSGVFLRHEPTQIEAAATERRSQAANRGVALSRLRLKLAVAVRSPAACDAEPTAPEARLRQAYRSSDLRINTGNVDYPAVLALVLNDLQACGGQPSLVAAQWRTTTSALIRLLKTHPPSFVLVNELRASAGRKPLK